MLNSIKSKIRANKKVVRHYLAPWIGLVIGIANWSKDFGVFFVVSLPFFFTNVSMPGFLWYSLAYAEEMLAIIVLVFFSVNRRKNMLLGFLYELGSSVNFFLFYEFINNRISISLYGILWNDIFFFAQLPLFALMFLNYFGLRHNKEYQSTQ